eukprot:554889-Hanusia_phi.AAC.2
MESNSQPNILPLIRSFLGEEFDFSQRHAHKIESPMWHKNPHKNMCKSLDNLRLPSTGDSTCELCYQNDFSSEFHSTSGPRRRVWPRIRNGEELQNEKSMHVKQQGARSLARMGFWSSGKKERREKPFLAASCHGSQSSFNPRDSARDACMLPSGLCHVTKTLLAGLHGNFCSSWHHSDRDLSRWLWSFYSLLTSSLRPVALVGPGEASIMSSHLTVKSLGLRSVRWIIPVDGVSYILENSKKDFVVPVEKVQVLRFSFTPEARETGVACRLP